MSPQALELAWLYPGLLCFGAAALVAVLASRRGTLPGARVQAALVAGVLLVGVAIALRWGRLGHGPFLNLYEILTSNLFSLGGIYALVWWRFPPLRGSAVVVLPVLAVLAAWAAYAPPRDTFFPPTYETPWLWVHVAMGKLFLATCLCGLGIAGLVPLRRRFQLPGLAAMADDAALDRAAWRFMLVALVFESLMLIAGAVWAQDAWGRYWAWDPLETWAFLTWLALVAAVHARGAYKVSPTLGAWMIAGVFGLAFLTFFGVPFISQAPHKGAV